MLSLRRPQRAKIRRIGKRRRAVLELLEDRRLLAVSVGNDSYVATEDAALNVPAPGVLSNDGGGVASGDMFHVSPSGSASGAGTANDPWDLQTALDQPIAVGPGDTIVLHGGSYVGGFTSRLLGTSAEPIIVRAAQGEHVKIDMYDADPATYNNFTIYGGFTRFQGFEVLSSDPASRQSAFTGSWPDDIVRGQVEVRGDHIKLINLEIHDLNKGVGFWSSGEGGEIYGSIIYNNGWLGINNPHGHGIYSQNSEGVKRITDNIIFNQFMLGVQVYGSSAAELNNYVIDGNAVFNSGGAAGATYNPRDSLLVGGGSALQNVSVTNNRTYQSGEFGIVSFGFNQGGSISVTDNYFHDNVLFRSSFDDVTFTGNHAGGMGPFTVESRLPSSGVTTGDFDWDGNEYIKTRPSPFKYNGVGRTFEDWKSITGWDTNSTIADEPTGTLVFVNPNEYEPGRGQAVVYNWDSLPSVDIDISSIVPGGASYEVYDVLDLHGAPVAQGVNASGTANIPMVNRESPRPIGYETVTPVTVTSEFGTFIIKTTSTQGFDSVTITASDAISVLGATVAIKADGSFSYDPSSIPGIQKLAVTEVLSDTFEYTVASASGSETATVTIDVSGRNDAPTAQDDSITTTKSSTVTSIFPSDDVDNDGANPTFVILSQPAEGVVAVVSGGSYTFDPAGDFDDLLSGGSRAVTFEFRAIDAHGSESDPATVTATVTTGPIDFGDAPLSYPTLLSENGARHVAVGPTLGDIRDAESEGTHSTDADADDMTGTPNDEDGVMFGDIEVGRTMAGVNINLGNASTARVDAWLDFDRDGVWDSSEQILDNATVVSGLQTLNFVVPASAIAGDTYARVRVSTTGGLDVIGLADDGEVEDYLLTILPAVAPRVESVVLNAGDTQRSSVKSATVTFDRVVAIDEVTGDPFQFTNTRTGVNIVDTPVVTVMDDKTVVNFTFLPGESVDSSGTLRDGDYQLLVNAALVRFGGVSLDGDGNGVGGDDYVYGADAIDNFFRNYGDANGNRIVDLIDFAAFRRTFGRSLDDADYVDWFDGDGDGAIGLIDFAQFRRNFGR